MKIGALVSVITMLLVSAACTPSPESDEWTDSHVELQVAGCKEAFVETRESMTALHADTYCRCMIGHVKARWSPAEADRNATSLMPTLEAEGLNQQCLKQALQSETLALPAHEANDPLAQLAARWVYRCERILAAEDSHPLDRELCACGTRSGAQPRAAPDRFRQELTECIRELLPNGNR